MATFWSTYVRRRTPNVEFRGSFGVGGRKAGETNDCTVIALSNATGKPYAEAHAYLASKGRKPRRGFGLGRHLRHNVSILGRSFSVEWDIFESRKQGAALDRAKQYGQSTRAGITLATAVKRFAVGTFIVIVTGHALVLKNGVQVGNYRVKPRARVTLVARVQPLLLAAPASI